RAARQGRGGGRARGAGPAASPAPAAAPAAKARTGVPECDSYLATFEKYAACDKLPPGRRENQQKALELARRGMAGLDSPNLPAETKAAAAKGCKDGEDAIKANAVPGCL